MSTNSETGHAKNVANFETIISTMRSYGEAYNPAKSSIALPALDLIYQNALNAITGVNTELAAYKRLCGIRQELFSPLQKLTTRVLNSLKASDSSVEMTASAASFARKLKGQRATPKMTDEMKTEGNGTEKKEISSSQMSFDNRIDNFDKLIQLLAGNEAYSPNEPELRVDALIDYRNRLRQSNTAVIESQIRLDNARIRRDEILYKPNTGLVDIAASVKAYIKSVFDTRSPQVKHLSALAFKGAAI